MPEPENKPESWAELPGEISTLKLFNRALDENISIVPGQAFSTGDRFGNYLRISFGSPVTEETRQGIARLRVMIKEELKESFPE